MGFTIKNINIKDGDYPVNLKEIHDPPETLYVMGTLIPQDEVAVAVVGTRLCSYYGMSTAERISYELASAGFTIVSGLARGIDSSSHKGALAAKGRTIAVLGCGLDYVYPPENKTLQEKILEAGAVVSEFPEGTPPRKENFPRRNRLISGLSLGVVVVEAGLNSGALITANLALEQGREVFSVPGQVNAINTKGTHRLLKEGARLVENADDVLEELEPLIKNRCRQLKSHKNVSETPAALNSERSVSRKDISLSDDENKIYNLFLSNKNRPIDLEDIVEQTLLAPNKVTSVLSLLEIKGIIRQIGGKQFVTNNGGIS